MDSLDGAFQYFRLNIGIQSLDDPHCLSEESLFGISCYFINFKILRKNNKIKKIYHYV